MILRFETKESCLYCFLLAAEGHLLELGCLYHLGRVRDVLEGVVLAGALNAGEWKRSGGRGVSECVGGGVSEYVRERRRVLGWRHH